MNEPTQDVTAPSGISRRDVMQRGAFVVGAAALWSTPIVQTLGQRPAAAGTPPRADFCPDREGRITTMTVGYTAKGCGHEILNGPEGANQGCTGHQAGDGPLPETAFIVINVGGCGGDLDSPGGTETFTGSMTKDVTEVDAGLSPSGSQACTVMRVYEDSSRSTLLVAQRIHTSCSREINIGDEYGPIRIIDGDGTWD